MTSVGVILIYIGIVGTIACILLLALAEAYQLIHNIGQALIAAGGLITILGRVIYDAIGSYLFVYLGLYWLVLGIIITLWSGWKIK